MTLTRTPNCTSLKIGKVTVTIVRFNDFSTGIYQNFGEDVTFRYVDFQLRRLGQLSFHWIAA